MAARTCLSIVLAAGEGTRMHSSWPKVMHAIGQRPLIWHVLGAVREASGATAVVVGPGQDAVTAEVKSVAPLAEIFVQRERRGTAHAVLAAKPAIARGPDDILIVFADTPLVRSETLAQMRALLAAGAAVVVNGGLMALRGDVALSLLEQIDDRNAKQEFYLTDVVASARARGLDAVVLEIEEDEVRGINTQGQLAEAEAVLQHRLRAAALEAGVTMMAPETVFLAADTKLGADVRIGNFVEVKEASIEAGARANHLSYIGDARVGAGANIGAGTITCNYDGVDKHRTDIGKEAFIGSNSALVAPVAIGDGAYVGSGSVISRDVPAGALAVARGRQVVKEGWAKRAREMKTAKKKSDQERAE